MTINLIHILLLYSEKKKVSWKWPAYMGNDRSLLTDHEYNTKNIFDRADFELLKNEYRLFGPLLSPVTLL